jgi:hypothetical protein
MPRVSLRKRVVATLGQEHERRQVISRLSSIFDTTSEEGSDDNRSLSSISSEGGSIEELLDVAVEGALASVQNRRYVLPRKPYRKGFFKDVIARDLVESDEDDADATPWLSDDEFREKYRVSRDSFKKLLDLIKDHPIFKSQNNKRQAPVANQLLLFLFYIGRAGSGASNPSNRNIFGLGRGTSDLYRKRVISALRCLRERAIRWPDQAERVEIALRIRNKYHWLNVCGFADGTLLPLCYEPQSKDSADYKGRKNKYTITMLVVNDDLKRIRYYHAGFPGCVHDNRVFRNTPLYKEPQFYFGNAMFLLGDSAFANTAFMVSAFKAPKNGSLPENESKFNTLIGIPRITCEHTIGMLKARFPWLRSIPMILTDNKNSMRRILRVVDCCVILHNLLINVGETTVPDDWLEVDDTSDEIATAAGQQHLADPLLEADRNDERRLRCMDYFLDQGLI